MKIAIDYTTGIYPGAGVAHYTRSLAAALAQIDERNYYSLFYAARGLPRPTPETTQARALFRSHRNFKAVPLPLSVRQMFAIWQRLRLPLPLELFTGRCDLVHSPDFVSPPHRTGADIITVHDLSFLVVPECAEPKLAAFLCKTVPAAVRRADHVIAVSEQTKRDLMELLGVPASKIAVAYNGVEKRFRPIQNDLAKEALKRKLGLPQRFILHVGTLEPRKNLKRLIEAYGMLVNNHAGIGEVALVLAGRKGWLFEPVLEAAHRVNQGRGKVAFVDHVHDEELPLLYNSAAVFAYPSLYEGFGMPAAESLACGVPALVSNDGALREVTGECALSVDARSVEEIAYGLAELLTDNQLRARLSACGPSQVERFTWGAAARIVLGVYEEVGT